MNTFLNSKNMKLFGPIMVGIGAFFWATDFVVRPQLISIFGGSLGDVIQFTMFEHLIATAVFLIVLGIYVAFSPGAKNKLQYKKFFRLNKLEIFSALWIGVAGSALGLVFFSLAFAQAATLNIASGYDQALFIQKVQPIVAISLAALLLKERLPKGFYLLVGVALIGFIWLNFGIDHFPFVTNPLTDVNSLIVLYAFLAAFCWGSATVFGKILVKKLDYTLTTLTRYVVGSVFLILLNLLQGTNFQVAFTTALQAIWFLFYAALISGGLIGLYIYYGGLKWTKASIATICELVYPIAGVVLAYFFLGANMSLAQWGGAIIILAAITVMSYINAHAPEPATDDKTLLETPKSIPSS